MSFTADIATYTLTARILHWLIAIVVLTAIPAAITMDRLGDGPTADFLYDLHRSLGATLIPLVALRVFWRMGHRPPPLPSDIPALQRRVALLTHWLLYVLIVIQPVLGWVATSAYRAPLKIFWLFELPPIWPENRALSDELFTIHHYIGWTLGVLVCVHIGAALYHHFIRRDRVLMRMIAGA